MNKAKIATSGELLSALVRDASAVEPTVPSVCKDNSVLGNKFEPFSASLRFNVDEIFVQVSESSDLIFGEFLSPATGGGVHRNQLNKAVQIYATH